MKKIVLLVTSLLMLAVLTIGLTLSASAEDVIHTGTWGDNLTWELNETTGHLTISGEGEMDNIFSNVAWRTFESSIKSATIENGVTSIGMYAFFACKNLTSINIPDSVTSIGYQAFLDCSSLAGVSIPNGVTIIENYAFSGCSSLTSITIPNSVTSIGEWAFSGCSSLTSITIPNSVTSIRSYAFSDCDKLKNVYITDLAAWCNIEFDCPVSNPLHRGGNLYINNNLATDIAIPDGVASIKEYAFYNYSSLKSITIPNSVTSIGSYAFSYCSSLKSITIPNEVPHIGEYTFTECIGLERIIIGESVTTILVGAFQNCKSLETVIIQSPSVMAMLSSKDSAGNLIDHATHILIKSSITAIPSYVTSTYEREDSCTISGVTYNAFGKHTWNDGEITTGPTHITTGAKTYTCTGCGATKTEDVAKLTAHTYADKWVPHNDEQHKKPCECGEALYDYHKWDSGVVNGNERIFTCYECGYEVAEQIAPVETTAPVQTTAPIITTGSAPMTTAPATTVATTPTMPESTTAPQTTETTPATSASTTASQTTVASAAPVVPATTAGNAIPNADAPAKSGCSGSAMGSVTLLLLLPAAFALRKKKED